MRVVGWIVLLGALSGCWRESVRPAPEECKLTTNPEACRKQFERR